MASLQKKLAEKIRKLRREQELSQQELAEKINMDITSINEIESGNRNPSLKTIEKIANALKVPIHELFMF